MLDRPQMAFRSIRARRGVSVRQEGVYRVSIEQMAEERCESRDPLFKRVPNRRRRLRSENSIGILFHNARVHGGTVQGRLDILEG